MDALTTKNLPASWDVSLKSENKVAKSDLSGTIFVVSTSGDTLIGLWNDKAISDNIYREKEKKCLQLITNSLYVHGVYNLEELYGISLELVQGLHNITVHGVFMPLSMV